MQPPLTFFGIGHDKLEKTKKILEKGWTFGCFFDKILRLKNI